MYLKEVILSQALKAKSSLTMRRDLDHVAALLLLNPRNHPFEHHWL